ncbi:uncharacterized protein LOC130736550 [Lotus japonicus]|uniref:uncharacterized protein LOC130736550 n=1 Tax=Lotus japonicus TaxID=34305 RepID=UPI002584DA35|nr:uncharacterized protein LOC130736550 [Lotus japonicus]
MSQSSGRSKKSVGRKIIVSDHGVKICVESSTPTPARASRSTPILASVHSQTPVRRSRRMMSKHSALKRNSKSVNVSPTVTISDDDQEKIIPDDQVDAIVDRDLETLADVAMSQRDSPVEKSQEDIDHSSDSLKEGGTTASEDDIPAKTPVQENFTQDSRKGKEKMNSEENEPIVIVMKKKSVSVQLPEKKKSVKKSAKKKKEAQDTKKKQVKASTGKKRKHISSSDLEQDVIPDAANMSSTAKKRIRGKRVPLNIPDAPMDNVSFHTAESAQRRKFVYQRRIAREKELSEEALKVDEIVSLLTQAGLINTVKDLGRCYDQLIREFIVNIPVDCNDVDSLGFRKVFVRGKCINFSPTVVNEFLMRDAGAVNEGEPCLHMVAHTLTGGLVKKWHKQGLLPSAKLSAKFAVLNKIGAANWVATHHTSGVTPQLAKMIYLIGTKSKFDFGTHVFEQTIKHAESYAVKLPIMFPTLLTELIVHQHPDIVRPNEPQDMVLATAKDIESASGSKLPGSAKKDVLAELISTSKTLEDTIHASIVRKEQVDQLIKLLQGAHGEQAQEDTVADSADEEEADLEEEVEAEVEEGIAAEEEGEDESNEGEEEEDISGSESSGSESASL